MAEQFVKLGGTAGGGGGGGGGAPTGPAGGDLSGTYPNPTVDQASNGFDVVSGMLNMLGNTLNMNDGSGSGGGTLSMDGGLISNFNVLYGSSGGTIVDNGGGGWNIDGGVSLYGGNLNMYDGSGSNGGTLNLDGGTIQGAGYIDGNITVEGLGYTLNDIAVNAIDATTLDLGEILSNGNNAFGIEINMGNGAGSGGGTLNMESGNLNLSDGGGTGGAQLNMDGGVLWGNASSGPSLQSDSGNWVMNNGSLSVSSYNLNMNDGSGSGAYGSAINLDQAQLFATSNTSGGAYISQDGSNGWSFVGDQISLLGTTFNLYDGSGFGGGNLNLDGGTINGGSGATLQDAGGVWDGTISSAEYASSAGNIYAYADSFNRGYAFNLNDGSGSGGGSLNMDSGTINGPLSFFGASPVSQQTGGAATAGAVYTSTEQGMLNAAYSALRAYGLLT